MLNGNPAFYNLPRKFKVSITGCRRLVHVSRDQRHRPHRRRAIRPAARSASRVSAWAAGSPPIRTSVSGSTPSCRRTARWRWSAAIAEIFREVRRAPAEPRARAPEVPVPAARLDRRAVPGGHRGRLGIALRAGRARGSAGRRRIATTSGIHPQQAAGLRATSASPCCGTAHAPSSCGWPPTWPTATAPARSGRPRMQNLVILNVATRRPGAARARARGRRLRARRVAVPARHGRLHRHRVLQARAHRDEGLRPRARRGAGAAPARVRAASPASTSPAARTAAGSTGSPTSASRARR